jgi:hypothetical protein
MIHTGSESKENVSKNPKNFSKNPTKSSKNQRKLKVVYIFGPIEGAQ